MWENDGSKYHEDEAAEILYSLCANEHITRSKETKEGKVELFAGCDGLFRVDVERVCRLNSLGEMMIATRQNNFPVHAGDKLAGTRVIPLVIEKTKMETAKEAVGSEPFAEADSLRTQESRHHHDRRGSEEGNHSGCFRPGST